MNDVIQNELSWTSGMLLLAIIAIAAIFATGWWFVNAAKRGNRDVRSRQLEHHAHDAKVSKPEVSNKNL